MHESFGSPSVGSISRPMLNRTVVVALLPEISIDMLNWAHNSLFIYARMNRPS